MVHPVREAAGIPTSIKEIGSGVGAAASLGAVLGLILATFARALFPEAEVSYGEWIGYTATLVGLLALVVELSSRAS